MALSVGSLCSGYEGLGLGLGMMLDTETEWVSEVDQSACAVLDARMPGVPNLGDLTVLDWSAVPPVDVLTAGYPCQPFSTAGRRQGANDARHLWPFIADAIGVLRPRLVVLENVAGHLSLGFDSVLADLARLRYDARWTVVRASDVGACHRRARLFIVAYPQHSDSGGRWAGGFAGMGRPLGGGRDDSTVPAAPTHAGSDVPADAERHHGCGRDDLPEPPGIGQLRDSSCRDALASGVQAAVLGPAPDAERSGRTRRARTPARGTRRGVAVGGAGEEPFPSRLVGVGSNESGRERPEPTGRRVVPAGSSGQPPAGASDLGCEWGGEPRRRRTGPASAGPVDWGAYGPAISRHAIAIGRPAPHPVDGKGRLNPAFVEWMMMLPDGWVTDIVTNRSKALKALGNGVVPPQAAYALRCLLT